MRTVRCESNREKQDVYAYAITEAAHLPAAGKCGPPADGNVKAAITGKEVLKALVVKGRLVNVVVN